MFQDGPSGPAVEPAGPEAALPRGISLRPVDDSDAETLFRIYASTRREEMALLCWSEAQRDEFLRQQFHAQDIHYRAHYPGARLLMIEQDQRPVGRLYTMRGEREIRIVDIALLPQCRGHGIGAALLADILAEADAAGLPVTLHVERSNPVRRFYERIGFIPVEDRGIYLFMERPPRAGGRADRE